MSAFGVTIGIACLTFFTALGGGVSLVARTRLFPADAATVEVVPPQVSLGALLGAGHLDEEALARLKAISGVIEAMPKMSLRVSGVAQYDGDFFGRPLHMGLEIVGMGVDPRLVASDLDAPTRFADPGPGHAIPIVVSTRLLELYNRSFAAQRGLPQLSPRLLTGFRFPVELGRSFVTAADGSPEAAQLEVVGFSSRALLGGVTMPLATVRRLNQAHGQDATTYSAVVLRASGADALPAIIAEVRRQGFDIDDSEQKLGEQVGWGIGIVTGALDLLSLLITLLAAVNIAHAFFAAVRERRREIGVLRALGASQRDIVFVLLMEAAMIGGAGAAVGLGSGALAAAACDLAARRVLPDFPFKPETFFHFTPSLLASAILVGLIASVLGALGPAVSAARSEPSEALAE